MFWSVVSVYATVCGASASGVGGPVIPNGPSQFTAGDGGGELGPVAPVGPVAPLKPQHARERGAVAVVVGKRGSKTSLAPMLLVWITLHLYPSAV